MKKLLLLLIFSILCFSFIYPFHNVNARSGCCSHHGGVCGCRCCDGTSLSAKCAPYYPQCSGPVEQKLLTTTISTSPKIELDTSKYAAQVSDQNGNFIWLVVLGLGVMGFIIYFVLRKRS